MAGPLVSDDLWALIAPLIPPERPKPKGGRPLICNRAALTGILFVLKSGIHSRDATGRDGLRLGDDVLAAPA
jgi:transposase